MVTTDFNDGTTSRDALTDEKEVGPNYTLELGNKDSVPVESISLSEEANTSEVQYTDSFAQSIAVTGVSYSGSFDIPGNADSIRSQGWKDGNDDSGNMTLPKQVSSMSLVPENGDANTYTFTTVLLSSVSKDIPSDDRTSQSFDFVAEKMYIK